LKRRRFLSDTPDERRALNPSGILGNIGFFVEGEKRFHH
jgi:hypothetical protein